MKTAHDDIPDTGLPLVPNGVGPEPSKPAVSLDQEIPCPLCRYDLRGLTEPRCPECGFRFTWPELLDPAKRLHPYLFEHHPERNVRSFFRTAWGGLRPKRFWTTLHPGQPSNPKRLLLYAVAIGMGLVGAVLLSDWTRACFEAARDMRADRQRLTAWMNNPNWTPWFTAQIQALGSPQAVIDAHAPVPTPLIVLRTVFQEPYYRRERVRIWLMVGVPYIAWPVLTFLTLLIFRWSMKRARVQPVHVFRCVVYSSDLAAWILILLIPAVVVFPKNRGFGGSMEPLGLFLAGLGVLVFAYRLRSAYRWYLRFDHPLATVFATQLIVLMIVLYGLAALMPFWFRYW